MPFIKLQDIEQRELLPGFRVRFVHTDSMTFAYWDIAAGATLPEHHHVHEQVANMLEGEFELTIEGVSRILRPGEVAAIPSNARHSGRALTFCRILDVFSPAREDYR